MVKMLSRKINVTNLALGLTLFSVICFHGIGEAKSFPFRAVDIGESLPAVTLHDLSSQQDVSLGQFADKPLLLVFFGADNSAKKKRAVKVLKAVNKVAPFATSKGVITLVVNAQGDSVEVIKDVMAAGGLEANVYTDVDRSAYAGLGVFVMPSLLLVSEEGKVAAGLGYSRDLAKKLKGEIEIMLGEKSLSQVEAELHPKVIERSPAEKGASRHFKLGLVMIERGRPESALREFTKAVSFAPDLGKAHIYLGCLLLDDNRIDEAQASLAKGLELEPGFVAGQICQARIKAEREDLAGAIEDLTMLLPSNSRNDSLHYALGNFLALKDDHAGAMKEYRKAYELLQKNSRQR